MNSIDHDIIGLLEKLLQFGWHHTILHYSTWYAVRVPLHYEFWISSTVRSMLAARGRLQPVLVE